METTVMERLKHFWISKWKPDSQETNRKPDLLNTSPSVKPRQCFTNYSRAASRSAGGQSVCWACARRAWQCFHALIAAVQLRVGLAVGHTISTAIDWQGVRRERWLDSDGPANPGEEAPLLHYSLSLSCWWKGAGARIKALVCLPHTPTYLLGHPSFAAFISPLCCLFWSGL